MGDSEEELQGSGHSEVTVHVPVTALMLNDLGVIRVGELLKTMDITACMSAERHCLNTAVTLSMDDVNFKDLRANVGDLLVLQSKVNRAFGTSMEVGLRVEIERPETQVVRHVCSSYFVFVALDGSGKKVKVPQLVPHTEREQVRWALAQDRRQIRLDHAQIIDQVVRTGLASVRISTRSNNAPVLAVEAADRNTVTQMVLPQHANHHGNTFGGVIMQWAVEICETVCVRHCKLRVALVSVDDMYFLNPSQVGCRIVLKANVNRVFHRSMEVGIRIESHSLDGNVALINKAYFTMEVAQDLGLGQSSPSLSSLSSTSSPPPPSLLSLSKTAAAAAGGKKDESWRDQALPQVALPNDRAKVRFKEAMGRRRVRLERLQLKSGSQLAWEFTSETDPRHFALENLRALERAAFQDEVLGAGNRGTWGLLSTTAGVEVYTKTSMTDGVSLKSQVVVTGVAFAAVVFAVLDCTARRAWDTAVTSYSTCQSFVPKVDADICHLAVDTREFDHGGKPTDFVLFRSWKQESDMLFVLASHSVIYKLVPEFPGLVRGQAANSGFIVKQIAANQVEVQYIMQLNTGSTSIVAGEMVGTSRLASVRMHALAAYCKTVTQDQINSTRTHSSSDGGRNKACVIV
ncbi:hypothetical protein BASA81_003042 [Batrachochytrium salamandrivorans]|nr:hypothetical protein BASA81_003042 [Batrachochytrium salamandrivorans]